MLDCPENWAGWFFCSTRLPCMLNNLMYKGLERAWLVNSWMSFVKELTISIFGNGCFSIAVGVKTKLRMYAFCCFYPLM